jgi:hypothetical protein
MRAPIDDPTTEATANFQVRESAGLVWSLLSEASSSVGGLGTSSNRPQAGHLPFPPACSGAETNRFPQVHVTVSIVISLDSAILNQGGGNLD